MRESSMREMISEVSAPFSRSSPRVLKAEKERLCTDQSAMTCFSFASMSFSLTALMQMSSMSSLCSRRGASMMLRREKVSDSTSNVCFVAVAILSQWRSFMDLLAISSRRGQHSLKSSIFCFKSLNACHSFKPFGSLRHLHAAHVQPTHITQAPSTLEGAMHVHIQNTSRKNPFQHSQYCTKTAPIVSEETHNAGTKVQNREFLYNKKAVLRAIVYYNTANVCTHFNFGMCSL